MIKIHWLFAFFCCHSAQSATPHFKPLIHCNFALSSIIEDDIAQRPFLILIQFQNGRNY
jgi:hypothetical protein